MLTIDVAASARLEALAAFLEMTVFAACMGKEGWMFWSRPREQNARYRCCVLFAGSFACIGPVQAGLLPQDLGAALRVCSSRCSLASLPLVSAFFFRLHRPHFCHPSNLVRSATSKVLTTPKPLIVAQWELPLWDITDPSKHGFLQTGPRPIIIAIIIANEIDQVEARP